MDTTQARSFIRSELRKVLSSMTLEDIKRFLTEDRDPPRPANTDSLAKKREELKAARQKSLAYARQFRWPRALPPSEPVEEVVAKVVPIRAEDPVKAGVQLFKRLERRLSSVDHRGSMIMYAHAYAGYYFYTGREELHLEARTVTGRVIRIRVQGVDIPDKDPYVFLNKVTDVVTYMLHKTGKLHSCRFEDVQRIMTSGFYQKVA